MLKSSRLVTGMRLTEFPNTSGDQIGKNCQKSKFSTTIVFDFFGHFSDMFRTWFSLSGLSSDLPINLQIMAHQARQWRWQPWSFKRERERSLWLNINQLHGANEAWGSLFHTNRPCPTDQLLQFLLQPGLMKPPSPYCPKEHFGNKIPEKGFSALWVIATFLRNQLHRRFP